jgi:hypothetical protein
MFFLTPQLSFFYRLLSFFLSSFYIPIDAFGLHIHIRLLMFCSHRFPNAHWLSSPQIRATQQWKNFRILLVNKHFDPTYRRANSLVRTVSSSVLEQICVAAFHALSIKPINFLWR